MGEEPILRVRPEDDRSYVPASMDQARSELPWYAMTRMKFGDLRVIIAFIALCSLTYYKVQAHDNDITALKATTQSKEAASADSKLILERIESLKDHVDSKFDEISRRLEKVEQNQDRRR